MSSRLLGLLATLLLLAACKETEKKPPADPAPTVEIAPILTSEDAVDVHSYAKPLEARVYHVALDLDVDFDASRIAGTATLDIDARDDAENIILDSRGLTIEKIETPDGKPLDFTIGESDDALGAPITVKIGKARKIVITYVAAPDASALQWLPPEQTAGKRHPFLLTQGQAIENRSWIPTQDSPGIRQSWEARIRVPNPLIAVMSAPRAGKPIPDGPDHSIYRFKMDKSVPPYLIAMAVGELKFQPLGLRTGVWAEPETLPAAAAELADTEKMVTAAEKLFGPYPWGRYDMIVLPPSFPFGGMENPTLTFLTPTFIAGDKSLTSLIAHELAHSWSGNLATNANWSHFWLNEGTTSYAEERIVEAVYGEKAYKQAVSLALDSVDAALAQYGPKDEKLAVDLTGRHPDDGLTSIAYDKGAAFLRMLEKETGREKFDAFMKGWFARHSFRPVTSSMFLDEVKSELLGGDEELAKKLELDQWVYGSGLPDNSVAADPEAFAEVDAAVTAFDEGSPPNKEAWSGWNTAERQRFLSTINRKLPADRLEAMESAFGLDKTGNNEVLFLWLKLAVANRYDPALPKLEEFLTKQGRTKFVAPLFEGLAADRQWGRPIAKDLYPKVRPLYNPITTRRIDKLGLIPASG